MNKTDAFQPLQEFLDSVITRLEALESAAGIHHAAPSAGAKRSPGKAVVSISTPPANIHDDSPAVRAYDDYVEKAVKPLVQTCKDLGEMDKVGERLAEAWAGVRGIVVLASRSRMPEGDLPTELQPHLKPIQDALEAIRKLRLDRKFDWHIKGVMEMATCLGWVLIRPPAQTPAAFCKEAIASCEFWTNKIRKEYKGKDDKQIAFCDAMKAVGNDLVEYITEYHRTGLTFNPKGMSLAEAALRLESIAEERDKPALDLAAMSPRRRHSSVSGGAGGMSSLMAELEKKRTADGSSAATGLRKVTKEQQTWRKEYKGEKASTVPDMPNLDHGSDATQAARPTVTAGMGMSTRKLKTGLPIFEYQERAHKWILEHQDKDSAHGRVLQVEISDPKQQVYMYDCEDITVQVKGEKLKSIIMDKCRRVNVVFDTCISSCEMVNSSKIQCQTTGVCPTFSIDKTTGCLIYLSKESLAVSTFVTSQSSEMNVSYPDGDEQKEAPIPEQFVHKLVNGTLTSEVSDLYH
jgi:adenylyl cyclase-associated protein